MLLILTHENADFDAIASQRAAQILYPQAIALLPWRVNRNVNQFLTLYWGAFDYIRPLDWKRQKIERVLLVDTQSLPSVRGIRADRVQVQVIDHHEVIQDHGQNWTYQTEPLGATTSLLVEMLQAAGHTLSANEATLLLLGIHEDTGSLIYDTTTARDVQASAWLMEQGAQLSVVRRFLNIPLSEGQQALYDQLEESAEWITIEGQNVLLSVVVAAEGFDDEISAVAHHLRDGLVPDGMFLLVQLKNNHLQLVARSATSKLDVSVAARALGGGGHSRAAAATIMNRSLDEVVEQIRALLPASVKPMVKVSEIMSQHGVQTLPSTTTISEAAEQMHRSGHEGYPVISPDDNRLVGLLTRRVVDRAGSHLLGDLPISQVMKEGQVTVRPSDSVERVQRLMIEEGWGQIPVVADDPTDVSGQIIGIVTRTDLINMQSNANDRDGELNMRRLMETSLPEALWGMVKVVSGVAADMDMPLYFVGGLVRDLILRKQPTDIDMVVEGDAIALVEQLWKEYGGETRSHRQFGTAKWLLGNGVWEKVSPGISLTGLPGAVDFVTARTEFYTEPSALPEVERGSIKLDLHRRDFTINTLAVRLDGAHLGELLDFYGGVRDLEQGLIRVLHSLSFIDDATRIVRAVRLEQRLGFTIGNRTAELIKAALPMLNRITGDRVRHELELCLGEEQRISIMERLAGLGVFAEIHPGLVWRPQTAEAYDRAEQVLTDPMWANILADESPSFIYFALLLLPLTHTVQIEVMDWLKVRKSTREDVVAASSLVRDLAKMPSDARPSQVVKMLSGYPDRVLLVVLAAAGPNSIPGRKIDLFFRQWRLVRPTVNGDDLLELGLKAGPQIGHILETLLDARLDGLVEDDSGERALLADLVNGIAAAESS